MEAVAVFEQALTRSERQVVKRLNTPTKIQGFLDELPYSAESIYRCPLRVLRDGIAHCFDGGLFAAAILRRLGHPPVVVNMLPNSRDDDHLVALFKRDGHWGAVAKSNFVGLRFREPIHSTVRELILSYFEQYYNVEREKTLRRYTPPLNLRSFDTHRWMTNDKPLDLIADRLDGLRPIPLLSRRMIAGLSQVDGRSYKAGMVGVNKAGLYRPEKKP